MTTRDIQAQLQERDASGSLANTHLECDRGGDGRGTEVSDASARAGLPHCLCRLTGASVCVRTNASETLRSRLFLAVNLEGHKERLRMWIAPSAREPAFWLSVLTELQNRGVKDIFIACVDGLTGLPEAIETVYPREPSAVVHGSYGESIRLGYVSQKHMRIGGDRSQSDLLGQYRGGSRVQSGTVC